MESASTYLKKLADAEMESANTYLKKLANVVTPGVQVDEMYQRIHKVVDMLQNALQCSWSYYVEQSSFDY
jgi:hypothetical protein